MHVHATNSRIGHAIKGKGKGKIVLALEKVTTHVKQVTFKYVIISVTIIQTVVIITSCFFQDRHMDTQIQSDLDQNSKGRSR